MPLKPITMNKSDFGDFKKYEKFLSKTTKHQSRTISNLIDQIGTKINRIVALCLGNGWINNERIAYEIQNRFANDFIRMGVILSKPASINHFELDLIRKDLQGLKNLSITMLEENIDATTDADVSQLVHSTEIDLAQGQELMDLLIEYKETNAEMEQEVPTIFKQGLEYLNEYNLKNTSFFPPHDFDKGRPLLAKIKNIKDKIAGYVDSQMRILAVVNQAIESKKHISSPHTAQFKDELHVLKSALDSAVKTLETGVNAINLNIRIIENNIAHGGSSLVNFAINLLLPNP